MAAVQNKGHNFPATSREANVDIYLIMPSCLEVSSGVCVCVCVGGGGGVGGWASASNSSKATCGS